MFTRSLFNTSTQSRQHDLLNRVATLIDNGTIRSTMTQRVEGIRADNLKAVHTQVESGVTRGKIVIGELRHTPRSFCCTSSLAPSSTICRADRTFR